MAFLSAGPFVEQVHPRRGDTSVPLRTEYSDARQRFFDSSTSRHRALQHSPALHSAPRGSHGQEALECRQGTS